jgi:hypothetical protein
LTPDSDFPDQPDYLLRVYDKSSGRELDAISNVTLRPVMDKTTAEGLNPYVLLEQTYEGARRKALKVEEALENLLEAMRLQDDGDGK